VVLPHTLAYDALAAPQAVAALTRARGSARPPSRRAAGSASPGRGRTPGRGAADPARALWEPAGRLGAPRSLRELGMTEADIARVANLAVAAPYANPRPAWPGAPPSR